MKGPRLHTHTLHASHLRQLWMLWAWSNTLYIKMCFLCMSARKQQHRSFPTLPPSKVTNTQSLPIVSECCRYVCVWGTCEYVWMQLLSFFTWTMRYCGMKATSWSIYTTINRSHTCMHVLTTHTHTHTLTTTRTLSGNLYPKSLDSTTSFLSVVDEVEFTVWRQTTCLNHNGGCS